MKHNDESALAAARRSRIFFAAAVCCSLVAALMGFAALSGTFAQYKGAAAAIMALLIMGTMVLGALGASQRSAARMKGWVPARELDPRAIEAKNRYLAALLEAEAARNAGAGTAAAEDPAQKAADADTGREQQPLAPDAPEVAAEGGAGAPADEAGQAEPEGAAGTPDCYERGEGRTEDMSEEEMVVAAAEALLAQAADAARKPADADEGDCALLSEETFMRLAGKSPLMRKDDDAETGDGVRSTIRTRRIARERIATVDKMLARTEDAVAVSRDLARSGTEDPAFSTLAAMLNRNTALEWTELPKVKPIKLTRNDRYWMSGSPADMPEDVFDALLSLEATYNINQDIQTMLGKKPGMEEQSDVRRRIIAVLSETARIKPDYTSKIDYLHCAYAGVEEGAICSDWALRNAIANAAENAELPFRISFDMMTNAAEGTALILLEVPRPDCFCFVAEDEAQADAFARDYALRSAVFMARAAFGASFGGKLKQAVVCCHPQGDPRTLLSVEATPETLPKLKSLTGCLAPMPVPVGYPAIRILCEDDWLDPVTPHILPGDDSLHPLRYIQLSESSDRECGALLAEATGAHRENELGTKAEAPMEQAWMGLGNLGDTVGSAVAAIRVISDEAETQAVKDGCDRAMRALVEGTVEPDRLDCLTAVYMGDEDLGRTLEAGLRAYTSQSVPDMERAVARLKEQLDPRMQISLIDDTETAFRYFHSIADRIHYNLTADDDRKVALVPHKYYSANEMTAYLLCQLGRADEAEPFAYEMRRIAPYAPASATILARVLERQERIREAIDVVNEALLHATTVHDAALCYYRMAYLQWRIGHEDLANASYRLTVALHTEISKQARAELDELLASNDELFELTPTAACKKLSEAGVRIWDLEGFRDKLAQAAILCADQQLYPAASQLTLCLLEFQKDDALTDVYRSFSV